MRFESEGDRVPMLCPGCCAISDIPDWEDWDAARPAVIVGCRRCGFTFPVLPAKFKALTLHAMHSHRCEAPQGPARGNWHKLGKAIMNAIAGKGEYPDLPPFPPAPSPASKARQP
jgi:hypothetical protein